MRYLILLFTFILMPVISSAQTYFKDGTNWKMRICGDPPSESEEEVYLNGTETVDGYEALKLFWVDEYNSHPGVYLYIRTDGDKVYFKPADFKDADWYLLYDFGLKVGEGCYVYDASYLKNYPKIGKEYIKCVGIDKEANSGLTAMTMQLQHELYNGTEFVWYKGLSSELGVLYNLHIDYDGRGSRLLEASYKGDIIYSYTPTNTAKVRTDELSVSTNGLCVTVTGIDTPSEMAIFSADGKLINRLSVNSSYANITLPEAGFTY